MATIMKNLSRSNVTYHSNDTYSKFINVTKFLNNLSNKISDLTSMISNKLSTSGGIMSGQINMNNRSIINLAYPISLTDAVNKNYVDSFMNKNKNGIDFSVLIEIAKVLYLKFKNDNSTSYFQDFNSHYTFVYKLVDLYSDIFQNSDFNNSIERLNNTTAIFDQLKFYVINLIENLPMELFEEAQKAFANKSLLKLPENGTDQKKFKKLINRAASRNSLRKDPQVELLIQKNILLLELGFIYLNVELLQILT